MKSEVRTALAVREGLYYAGFPVDRQHLRLPCLHNHFQNPGTADAAQKINLPLRSISSAFFMPVQPSADRPAKVEDTRCGVCSGSALFD